MEKDGLLTHWPQVRKDLLILLDLFSEEDLVFLPAEGGWSVGRILLHIGSAAEFWLHSGILSSNNTYQPGNQILENYPSRLAIKAYLCAEHRETLYLLENFDENKWHQPFLYPDGQTYRPSWIFWHVLEHEIHHRGELSMILGLLGKRGLEV